MGNSTIEWTEKTWNPTTGCTKLTHGCTHCYASLMARRLQAMGKPAYKDGFKLTLHPELLTLPDRWRKPSIVFVNSMSDVFHKDVPEAFIKEVFQVMERNPRHTFQVLTKRSERLALLAHKLPWPSNVWMGVSVEMDRYYCRIRDLATVPARVRFLSCEPLLGPLANLPLDGIHWVIAGGESGQGARPMDPDWVRNIRDQCVDRNTPFFFKQWGGRNKKKAGKVLDGREWQQMPC